MPAPIILTLCSVTVAKTRTPTPVRTITVIGPATTTTIRAGAVPAYTPAAPAYVPPAAPVYTPPTSTYSGAALAPVTDQLRRFHALASRSTCTVQLDTSAGFVDTGGAANPHYVRHSSIKLG